MNRSAGSVESDRWVVHISSKPLTSVQTSVLQKGLNFAPAPRKIPVPSIVAAVEQGLREVREESIVKDVRLRVAGALLRARPPASNLSGAEARALKEIKQDKDLMVLRADKGGATVVMDRGDYEGKMHDMLQDRGTYKRLENDPTIKIQRKMNRILLKLKHDGELDPSLYARLYCSSGRIPSIYGLPKIHKPAVPLRPIVSFITSPTYALSAARI